MKIYTLGHGTKTLDEFLMILKAHRIRQVVDARSIPRSRHNPQFNRETLSCFLRNRRIGYRHMKALGGLRRARPDSENMGWRSESFRGFADYMQTPDFEAAVKKLVSVAENKATAVICAESVPWRCHRSLIADALKVRGFDVFHIYSPLRAAPHKLTSMALVNGARITYPPLGFI